MTIWTDPTILSTAATAAAVGGLFVSIRFRRRERELVSDLEQQGLLLEEARDTHQQAQVELARLGASLEAAKESKADVEQLREQLRAHFAEDAGKVLTSTSRQFLELADSKLQNREQVLDAKLSQREASIDATIKPLQDQLAQMSLLTKELDGKRENAMGALLGKLGHLDLTTSQLRDQSQALAETLKGNVRVRGRWGEQTLRRIAEIGGLVEQCDFFEQQGSGEARPDMVVRLPEDGQVPIDAKAPLEHFLKAHECQDPERRTQLLRAHADCLRVHVRALAKRDYPAKLGFELGFTVLFLPTEPMLAVAMEQLPELFEEAQRNRVLLATPMTLLAMLKTIAVSWGQRRMVENAKQIAEVARELYDRVATFQEHMEKVGKGLQSASAAYQSASSSYSRRIVPTGRKLVELGGGDATRREIGELPDVSGPEPAAVLALHSKEAGA